MFGILAILVDFFAIISNYHWRTDIQTNDYLFEAQYHTDK